MSAYDVSGSCGPCAKGTGRSATPPAQGGFLTVIALDSPHPLDVSHPTTHAAPDTASVRLMTEHTGFQLLTENLRRLTEAKKIPLAVLADRAGIDRAELFAAMAGEIDPDLNWLNRLADVLEVHVADLLEEPGPKPKPS